MSAPVLWHLKVSHYNEKARWALDHKRVPHVRRAAIPGRHRDIARKLTGASTFPVLVLDDQAIGDSTRIIAWLEEHHPEPSLYPADPRERRRALELEDHFDEQLGPYTRLLLIHHVLPDAKLMLGAFTPDLRGIRRGLVRAQFPLLRKRIVSGFGIDSSSVALAFEKLHAAGERFRDELQPSGYLAGAGFSVADLALSALVAPIVAPEQFPYPQPQRGHPLVAPLRDALSRYGLDEWARGIYARHRPPSAAISDLATRPSGSGRYERREQGRWDHEASRSGEPAGSR
jgi:glutathione S-transferase